MIIQKRAVSLMKVIPRKFACALVLGVVAFNDGSTDAASVIHWINDSNQDAASVLNGGGSFTTTFRTSNDVTATELSGHTSGQFVDNFGGPTPGNNPGYLTTFVGSTGNGTGDGTAGHVAFLDMAGTATGSMQFDFAQPITSADRLLFVDPDSTEQYHIEAFTLVGATYVSLSELGWTYETFSGQTGVTPDSRWPTWNPVSGLLTATSSALNEELSVLTPDQLVSRLVISKTTGAGASTGFQVIEVPSPTGDYNGNHVVDAGDYVVWRKTLNGSASPQGSGADGNSSGTIDAGDYTYWRARFGNAAPGSGASVGGAVPEPATLVLMMLAAAGGCLRRHRAA
jgi:PEP-CTERM motif